MNRRGILALFAVLLATSVRPVEAQDDAAATILAVVGEVEKPLKLTAADLAKLPHQTLKARDRNDQEVTFEGVTLVDILKEAGVPFGTALRGKGLSLYLVVEASDGYRAVFSLPEIDPAYNDRVVILADRREGAKLSTTEGPLRVVVSGEKRPARWVRQVISLRIGRG